MYQNTLSLQFLPVKTLKLSPAKYPSWRLSPSEERLELMLSWSPAWLQYWGWWGWPHSCLHSCTEFCWVLTSRTETDKVPGLFDILDPLERPNLRSRVASQDFITFLKHKSNLSGTSEDYVQIIIAVFGGFLQQMIGPRRFNQSINNLFFAMQLKYSCMFQ